MNFASSYNEFPCLFSLYERDREICEAAIKEFSLFSFFLVQCHHFLDFPMCTQKQGDVTTIQGGAIVERCKKALHVQSV